MHQAALHYAARHGNHAGCRAWRACLPRLLTRLCAVCLCQVARAQGGRAGLAQAAKRRMLPAAVPQPNSGVGPIALVGALLAASLYWSREGHKLRGRKLPLLLERLRRLLGGSMGSSTRRSVRSAAAAPLAVPPVTQQRAAANAADRRALAAAAAEQRLRAQAQVRRALGRFLSGWCGARADPAGRSWARHPCT